MSSQDQRSGFPPWVWIGCGCVLAVLVAIGAVVGLGWWGFRSIEQFGEEMRDPEAREAKVLETLGAEELPPGFHPGVAFSVPLVLDLAVLMDRPVEIRGEEGSFEMDTEDFSYEEQLFVFMRVRPMGNMEKELDPFFAGQQDTAEAFGDQSPGFHSRRVITRGELEVNGAPVRYRTDLGLVDGDEPALVARLQWLCPDAGRLHLATWYTPAPASRVEIRGEEGEEPRTDAAVEQDLQGTLGDENELRRVLSYFAPCR